MAEYIERQAAIDTVAFGITIASAFNKDTGVRIDLFANENAELTKAINRIRDLTSADVVPYSIEPDGTLTVTVPKGTKRIGRILIEEDGTQYGGLFYPDTGGCFLSSMERSEQDG